MKIAICQSYVFIEDKLIVITYNMGILCTYSFDSIFKLGPVCSVHVHYDREYPLIIIKRLLHLILNVYFYGEFKSLHYQ